MSFRKRKSKWTTQKGKQRKKRCNKLLGDKLHCHISLSFSPKCGNGTYSDREKFWAGWELNQEPSVYIIIAQPTKLHGKTGAVCWYKSTANNHEQWNGTKVAMNSTGDKQIEGRWNRWKQWKEMYMNNLTLAFRKRRQLLMK